MEPFSKTISSFTERFRNQLGGAKQVREKRWIAYGVLLAISLILFLAVGGSKQKYPDFLPSGGEEIMSSEVFRDLSEKLVGLRKPKQLGMDWETVPEGIIPVYKTWGRDPFVSEKSRDVERQETAPDLKLSAISWKGGEPIVLINDLVLRRGESVEGAEVVEIYPRSVVLISSGERIVLSLDGGS